MKIRTTSLEIFRRFSKRCSDILHKHMILKQSYDLQTKRFWLRYKQELTPWLTTELQARGMTTYGQSESVSLYSLRKRLRDSDVAWTRHVASRNDDTGLSKRELTTLASELGISQGDRRKETLEKAVQKFEAQRHKTLEDSKEGNQ